MYRIFYIFYNIYISLLHFLIYFTLRGLMIIVSYLHHFLGSESMATLNLNLC